MNIGSHPSEFRKALSAWYAVAHRPLPWRTQPSLYRTVVSEFMTQQTKIKTMLPYFDAWMRSFPDFDNLAKAADEDVLKHWEGLGYYSRARNLHKLAKIYIGLESKPQSREEWQQLPGIGPYTSAAISSIALGQANAVVDGNVVRVLARLKDDARKFKNNGAAVKAFTATADDILDGKNPGIHNQAMMELGATVCLKNKPLCAICPVAKFCVAKERGTQEERPKIESKTIVKVEINRAWVRRGNRLLLHHISESSTQLAGQYELPELKMISGVNSNKRLLSSQSRSITHRRIKEHIYKCTTKGKNDDLLEWIPLGRLERITLSGPHRRWVRDLLKIDN